MNLFVSDTLDKGKHGRIVIRRMWPVYTWEAEVNKVGATHGLTGVIHTGSAFTLKRARKAAEDKFASAYYKLNVEPLEDEL